MACISSKGLTLSAGLHNNAGRIVTRELMVRVSELDFLLHLRGFGRVPAGGSSA
jgi:hypothetical protein